LHKYLRTKNLKKNAIDEKERMERTKNKILFL